MIGLQKVTQSRIRFWNFGQRYRRNLKQVCERLRFELASCIGAPEPIALLDGVYLPLYMSNVSFKVIDYGLPRGCAIIFLSIYLT